jgi:ABC-type polysaccharide/polyol phosphate transport system ATPase subunit/SAM-dependent methyltransferase
LIPIIEAQGVSKKFFLRHNAAGELKVHFLSFLHPEHRRSVEEFWALRDVSLRIGRGEAVGLVGRNGSGKSTLLKLIAAIHRPNSGHLLVARGARIASMMELGVGFHPELTGRENVFLNAAIHGLTRAETERIYDAVVRYSGLEHFMDVPIKTFSSGMHMRLGFAVAANLDPDILLLDEIFAVGDADFQQRCIATVTEFIERGKTMIFVSHSPAAVRSLCSRVCVLDEGQLVHDGDVDAGFAFYDRLRARQSDVTTTSERLIQPVKMSEEELDRAPHRRYAGGRWREVGRWQFEFLREQGLQRHHFVFEVGCGSLAAAVHLLPFLELGHYLGMERHQDLLDAGRRVELPRAGVDPNRGFYFVGDVATMQQVHRNFFDIAFAGSALPYLSLNGVVRCIASVLGTLKPTGRFYASWYESPDVGKFDPMTHPGGITTYSDREPYHHPFRLIDDVCRALGANVERVVGPVSPRGETILLITPRPS